MTLAEFNKTQRTQMAGTGARLELADGAATAEPNPKQRASRGEKGAARLEKEESQEAKNVVAKEKKASAVARAEAGFKGGGGVCPRCTKQFLTKGWFNRHGQRWCKSPAAEHGRRLRERDVRTIVASMDALAVEQREVRIQNLDKVEVKIQAPKSEGAELGVEMETRENGFFFVKAVHGLAEKTSQVSPGFIVQAIDGVCPTSMSELSGIMAAGSSKILTLRRPRPPIPFHGAARKGLHKKAQFKMHAEQEKWLKANAFVGGRSLLRPKDAWMGMKAHFSGQLRVDTMTPMWLEKDQISAWLARQVSHEKARRKEAQKAEDKAKKKATGETAGGALKRKEGPPTGSAAKKAKTEAAKPAEINEAAKARKSKPKRGAKPQVKSSVRKDGA